MKMSVIRRFTALLLAGLCFLALPATAAEVPRVLGRGPSQPVLRLQPILAPSSGSAAFYITEEISQEIVDVSGFFALVGESPESTYSVRSIRAHYTVLSSVDDTVRLLVRAQPVDPWTGLPLAPAQWEAVYTLTPEGPDEEWSDEMPASYEELVEPSWLADWAATELEDLPTGPLLPGAEWSGPANLDWDDLGIEGLGAPVFGTFVGWIEDGDLGSIAHVWEGVATSSSVDQEFFPGIIGNQSIAIDISADHWLIPGDFPYGSQKRFYMESVLIVGPSTGVEGLEGSMSLVMDMGQSIDRDWSDEIWLPYEEKTELELGESVSGLLGPWSETFDDGTYLQTYAFEGTEGDVVRILMRSDDFDAFVMLTDDAFEYLAYDDDSGGGTDALIEYELPYTGLYHIIVNTLSEYESGLYTLTLELADGV